jgi:hypothetical protein
VVIVVYRASWVEIFSTTSHLEVQRKKKEAKKKERGGLLKLPQLMEIEIGGLRHLFLDDFHKAAWISPSDKTCCGLSTVPTGPAATNKNKEAEGDPKQTDKDH